MPDFSVIQAKMTNYGEAAALLARLQQIYAQCSEVANLVTLYQADTNEDFNAAIDAIFNAGERQQLATMLGNVQALVAAWDANHSALLAPEE